MPDFRTVARLEELPELGGKEIILDGRRICLLKHNGEVFATAAECPHKAAPLAAGWVENGHIFCALHGWEFDLQTGNCTNVSGCKIQIFSVRVIDGEVQVLPIPANT
jgi:nitrite reductase/ring-hydroxylating ferredoxin subunit